MQTALDRRAFVKTAGASTLGIATLTLGTAAQAEEMAVVENADDIWALGEIAEPTETMDAEAVIVGAGGTGLTCAVQLAELGVKPLLVERLGVYGGTFHGTEGMLNVGSKYQMSCGDPEGENDTVYQAIEDYMNYHHWYPDYNLVSNVFNACSDTIDWLEEHGVKFGISCMEKYRGLTWAPTEDHSPIGSAVISALSASAESLGVETMFETRARKVLVEDNKVTGILVEKNDGTIVQINTSAVMMASGGYSDNKAMIKGTSLVLNEPYCVGITCCEGDGLKMAKDAGAVMADGLGCIMWGGAVIKDSVHGNWQVPAYIAATQPFLYVNGQGKRFMREDHYRDGFTGYGMNFRNQPKTYIIMDDAAVEHMEQDGTYFPIFTIAAPGRPVSGLRADLEALEAVHIADTIEEAAEAASLDPEAVRATADRYNALCEAAVDADPEDKTIDEDFHKRAGYMVPVATPPFYVCEAEACLYTTCGGIKINGDLQALNADNAPVIGLYAAGCDAGSLHGDSYDQSVTGGSMAGFAMIGGRLAGQSIAKFLAE